MSRYFKLLNSSEKGIAQIAILLILLAGIGISVYLVLQKTVYQEKAKAEGESVLFVNSSGQTITETTSATVNLKLLPNWEQPEATLKLYPSTGVVNKECNYKLDIALNTKGVRTIGTDVVINFDPLVFRVLSVTNGALYAGYPVQIDNVKGIVGISGLSAEGFGGSGRFATLNVVVLKKAEKAETNISFDFDPNNKTKTTDSNVVTIGEPRDILSSVDNGKYIVRKGKCSPDQVIRSLEAEGIATNKPNQSPTSSPPPTITDKFMIREIVVAEDPYFKVNTKRFDYVANPGYLKYVLSNITTEGEKLVYVKFETLNFEPLDKTKVYIDSVNGQPFPAKIYLKAPCTSCPIPSPSAYGAPAPTIFPNSSTSSSSYPKPSTFGGFLSPRN